MSNIREPVVAYLRISKDRDGNLLGVERQRWAIEQLEIKLGVKVCRWYTDNDVSAFAEGKVRPEFEQLMIDVQVPGRVGTVLTYHNDRIIRKPYELEAWIRNAPETSVYSYLSGEYDLSTVDGRALARILGAIAAKDSEHQSKRIRDQKLARARAGLKIGGGRPFGYTLDGMELDPWESKLIQKAASDIISEGKPIRQICREWNERGARTTRAGREFEPAAVTVILLRPRNAALVQHRGEIVGKAAWTPILTDEVYAALKEIMSNPARRTNPGTAPRWQGSGIYLCGIEGCTCTVRCTRNNGKKAAPAYQCRAKLETMRTVPGNHVQRRVAPVDELVDAAIVGYLSDPDTRDALEAIHAQPGEDLSDLRSELLQIEANQRSLTKMLTQPGSGWSIDMVTDANRDLASRRLEIEGALSMASSTSTALRVAQSTDVEAAFRGAELDVRRLILNELVVVTILPTKVRGLGPGGKPYPFDRSLIDIAWVA